MGEARRAALLKLAAEYGVMIFEDECYSDLVWTNKRPPSLYAMAKGEGVIFIGSFSKSLGPALRVGYIVAKWDVLSRLQALKQDAGTGAIEQMVLAEYCSKHFADHVTRSNKLLASKMQVLREALAEQFGTAAEFGDPPGGIYLWIKLPENVDTMKLAQAALAAGVSINPGPEWSVNPTYSRNSPAGSASPIPSPRRSSRASRCWPRSADASSACPCAAPISTSVASFFLPPGRIRRGRPARRGQIADHDLFLGVVFAAFPCLSPGRRGRMLRSAYLFASAITIHMMPNLSVTMPNLEAKKVLVSGCST